jgi:hypothetical protein
MLNLSIIVVILLSFTVSVIYNFIYDLLFADKSSEIIKLLIEGAILNYGLGSQPGSISNISSGFMM